MTYVVKGLPAPDTLWKPCLRVPCYPLTTIVTNIPKEGFLTAHFALFIHVYDNGGARNGLLDPVLLGLTSQSLVYVVY